MNPRVSRSSALASKATGFPSPKSPPSLRWATTWTRSATTSPGDPGLLRADHRLRGDQGPALHLRKIPAADATLTTQMKSVGEVMAIGRTFKESLQKAIRSLEIAPAVFESRLFDLTEEPARPDAERTGPAAGKAPHRQLGTPLVPGRCLPHRDED